MRVVESHTYFVNDSPMSIIINNTNTKRFYKARLAKYKVIAYNFKLFK